MALPKLVQILLASAGVLIAFSWHGTLQEDILHNYKAADGSKFHQTWFLAMLESFANVAIGGIGLIVYTSMYGTTRIDLPLGLISLTGLTQVSSKSFTSMAQTYGVPFYVATLAKSAKLLPVMFGSILFGGAIYQLHEYASVGAIVLGTIVVSWKKQSGSTSNEVFSIIGPALLCTALLCDAVTAGVQKRTKNSKLSMWDNMFWTNLSMTIIGGIVALVLGEIDSALSFCHANPEILYNIVKFSLMSALGQICIFWLISIGDPTLSTTVTTARKVISVLLSIIRNGHTLEPWKWAGLVIAIAGIVAEVFDKSSSKGHSKAP